MTKQDVHEISDDSDRDEPTQPLPRIRRPHYRAEHFSCDDVDLDRVVKRYGWLSGPGLGTFLHGEVMERNLNDISIVDSRVLADVAILERDVAADGSNYARLLQPIQKHLEQVSIYHLLVSTQH